MAALSGLLLVAGLAVGLWAYFPFPESDLDSPAWSARVYDRDGSLLRAYVARDGTWRWPVELDRVSPWLIDATIAAEDARFRAHPGVDPVAVCRAALQNLSRGRIFSGASTLTMQTVRLLHPRPRTFCAKTIEAFRALQLERIRGKEEILELYLNLAPYGGNLYGVEIASHRYFGKRAQDLTLGEAALLAGLPQSPSRYRPDRHPDRAFARRRYVLRRMVALGMITAERAAAASSERTPVCWHALNLSAPHFCDMALGGQTRPCREGIRTTLDPAVQAIAEEEVRHASAGLQELGARGAAAVVLDNATASVVAMVGSPCWHDRSRGGQVNAALAPRSPGSTLKPFIYGLAFDQGVLAPQSMLSDAPARWAGYAPTNFDGSTHGPVRADEALRRSLNIPAVEALGEAGLPAAHALLRRLGLTTIDRPTSHYGLSLALGGCEVRLRDLAGAYGTLARLGEYRPVVWRNGQAAPPVPVLDAGASWMVAEALRTDLVDCSGKRGSIAVKTGTSPGLRDAWAVAYDARFTVAVWVGNPEGRPAAALVGSEAALPVACAIFARLGVGPWFERPGNVETGTFCAETGRPASARCPATVVGFYLANRPRGPACPPHMGQSAPARGPRIISPGDRERFLLIPGRPNQAVQLDASPAHTALTWFVDGRVHSATALALAPGSHEIRCVDSAGRSDAVVITVELWTDPQQLPAAAPLANFRP